MSGALPLAWSRFTSFCKGATVLDGVWFDFIDVSLRRAIFCTASFSLETADFAYRSAGGGGESAFAWNFWEKGAFSLAHFPILSILIAPHHTRV
ncbi:hypothetical protein [Verrucomicrobium sp. BvORR106]|uniref:hypothetical protein n=1 Tax=Verrucomicrobium sp. BvORR106 TaxID=1403819 RepID=UPI002240F465|nr:hypothetical protein [Verrucomicrobium sp. BvORR106]